MRSNVQCLSHDSTWLMGKLYHKEEIAFLTNRHLRNLETIESSATNASGMSKKKNSQWNSQRLFVFCNFQTRPIDCFPNITSKSQRTLRCEKYPVFTLLTWNTKHSQPTPDFPDTQSQNIHNPHLTFQTQSSLKTGFQRNIPATAKQN